jgi:stage V sporulation protein R
VDERGGRQKIYGVRKIYNDLRFVDTFLTEDFCREHGFFAYEYDRTSRQYVIESRQFAKIKESILGSLTNFGQPIIDVVDANFGNRGELLLRHSHTGADLKMDWAETTLGNLTRLWKRPVHLLTRINDRPLRVTHTGEGANRTWLDRKKKKTASDETSERTS